MAIADNVLGRLVRFNAARGKQGEQPRVPVRRRFGGLLLRGIRVLRWLVLLAILALIGWAANYEMRTSYLEAWLFTRIDRAMSVAVEPGSNDSIRFPKHGPYDERLGYTALPQFISARIPLRPRVSFRPISRSATLSGDPTISFSFSASS